MKHYLIAGITLLVVTNIVTLSSIFYNRMGEPLSQIILSERELNVPYSWQTESFNNSENTALSLNFEYQPSEDLMDLALSSDELAELGFTFVDDQGSFWSGSRVLYWALEYNGAEYLRVLQQARQVLEEAESKLSILQQVEQQMPDEIEQAKQALKYKEEELTRVEQSDSRLYLIDYNTELDILMSQYVDKPNVLFMKGLTKPYLYGEYYYKTESEEEQEASEPNKEEKFYGLSFSGLLVPKIHMPVQFSLPLHDFIREGDRELDLPRYQIELVIGKRLEPVVRSVSLIPHGRP